MGNRGVAAWLATVSMAVLLGLGASSAGARAVRPSPPGPPVLLALHAVRGADPRIVDRAGREVLLRGVDEDALGQYYQQYAADPPVLPLTSADSREMASLGFNVQRLLVNWSALEPTRGAFDLAYVARIRQAVDWAAAQGIYTVLDMHQDAYGIAVMSPPGTRCPPGESPAIGFDGAPAWATDTDGLSTCAVAGVREISLADEAAWQNFYTDHDGIETQLVDTWAKLAAQFADDPAVAGYDLLNEPNPGLDLEESTGGLGDFYSQALAAIRIAEQSVPGGFSHIAFFEPGVEWSLLGTTTVPEGSFTEDPNIVFAPHLYGGSLAISSVDDGYTHAARAAQPDAVPVWSGEYGWFAVPIAADRADMLEFAADQDAYRWGGAWWQWKQACGSPSSVGSFGAALPAQTPSLVEISCRGSQLTTGPTPAQTAAEIPALSRAIVGRATVHAAPGVLSALHSDPISGAFSVNGVAAVDLHGIACQLTAWIPGARPRLVSSGVSRIALRRVSDGYDLGGCARGRYFVGVAGR